jgi:hypothetical protein
MLLVRRTAILFPYLCFPETGVCGTIYGNITCPSIFINEDFDLGIWSLGENCTPREVFLLGEIDRSSIFKSEHPKKQIPTRGHRMKNE